MPNYKTFEEKIAELPEDQLKRIKEEAARIRAEYEARFDLPSREDAA